MKAFSSQSPSPHQPSLTKEELPPPRNVYYLLTFLAIIVLSLIAYLGYNAINMSEVHTPLVNAAMEIKIEATSAHLWFEEIISGDRQEGIMEDVWEHIENADWYATAMLEGGKNEERKYIPLDDPELRDAIQEVKTQLLAFRGITAERLSAVSSAGVGSPIDQQYDKIFNDFIAQADYVEAAIQEKISAQLHTYRLTQYSLMGVVAFLFVVAGFVFRSFEGERARAFRAVLSARQRAEASEKWLSTTLQSIGDAIIATDVEGRVTRMNPIAEDLTGWVFADAEGLPLPEVFHIINPRTRERVEDPVEKVFREGEVIGLANHTILIAKDGSEHQIADSAAPIRAVDGDTLGVVMVFRDVTDEYGLQQALLDSEERYRNIVDSSPMGMHMYVYHADDSLIFSGANPAANRILGVDNSIFINKTIEEAFPSLAESEVPVRYRQAAAEGVPWSTEQINYQDEHIVGAFEVHAFQTSPGKMVATFLDITGRKRKEQERDALIRELEDKNAELERFTYTVSHDLKSPLITIQGFLGLFSQDMEAGDTERVETDIKSISNAVVKMQLLLDELLELSRIGRLVHPSEEVSMAELVAEAVEMVTGRLTEQGIHLVIDSDLPVVYGDRPRLREVLENLLDNATKFMHDQENPRIEIGCRREGNEEVYFVCDNGMGIDPRYHEKVFGLFETLDPGTGGIGVGLAIVKRIVELHGGLIWVESEGVGQGSTFCFTISSDLETLDEEVN